MSYKTLNSHIEHQLIFRLDGQILSNPTKCFPYGIDLQQLEEFSTYWTDQDEKK